MAKAKKTDVRVENNGSIVLFRLFTKRAEKWVRENVQAEPWQFLGNALAVEPRYAQDLAAGMQEDGLAVA